MSIAYLISKAGLDVLQCMIKHETWEGDKAELNKNINELEKRYFLIKNDHGYTIERGIYGMISAMIKAQTEGKCVHYQGGSLYKNNDLWIFLEKDQHAKNNYKLRPYKGQHAFEVSEEGKRILEEQKR